MTVELADRKKYIGASDAAGVLGMSRWDTPLSVWCKKTDQFQAEREESEEMEWGKDLEPNIIRWFQKKTGKKVVAEQEQVFHAEHPFLGCTVDGLIEGEDAGFEAKTCSAWKAKEWEGEEIPQEYILQAYHSMMVTGRKKWYIAVLIGGQRGKWKELLYDTKIIEDIKRREVKFWNDFVLTRTMPTIITKRDSDTLDSLFPSAQTGKIISLGDEANILIENLTANKQDYKALKGLIDEAENKLKAMLGDAETGSTGLYNVKWTNSKRSQFDAKALLEIMPEVHQKFYVSTPARRFTYKPVKGE